MDANRDLILITGFGRFPGAAFNPSGPLARALARRRRPLFGDTAFVSHVFPTRYGAVDRDLPDLIARHRPTAIIMFGLAARTPHVRIETTARNALSSFPDAGRYKPISRTITAGAAPRRSPPLSFMRLLHAGRVRSKDVVLSRDAGRYVCNYLYWRAIGEMLRPSGPRLVAFIHIPLPRVPSRPRAASRPRSPSTHQIERISEAILAEMLAATRRRVR